MINIQPPAHQLSVHAAALREAAERRARAQRDLVVASLLPLPGPVGAELEPLTAADGRQSPVYLDSAT
jgi:hypothetical protein